MWRVIGHSVSAWAEVVTTMCSLVFFAAAHRLPWGVECDVLVAFLSYDNQTAARSGADKSRNKNTCAEQIESFVVSFCLSLLGGLFIFC